MPRIADPDSPTKKKLLDAAEKLILEKGFSATTVDDICDQAKLTKGSFFHYFETKEALGMAVIDHTMAYRRKVGADAPFLRLADPLERILGGIDFIIKSATEALQDKGGCLLGDLAQELSYTHPNIRSKCAECLSAQAQTFVEDFKAAKAKYSPKSSIDPTSLAEHLVAIGQGALLLAKAKQDPKVVRENLLHYKEYVRLLFGGK